MGGLITAVDDEDARRFVDTYNRMYNLPPADDMNGGYDVKWFGVRSSEFGPIRSVMGLVDTQYGCYIHLVMHDTTRAGLRAMARLCDFARRTFVRIFWVINAHDEKMIRHYLRLGASVAGPYDDTILMIHPGYQGA